jgi:hypothetical protein
MSIDATRAEEFLAAARALLDDGHEVVRPVLVGGAASPCAALRAHNRERRRDRVGRRRSVLGPRALPRRLEVAVARVARDLSLPADWFNSVLRAPSSRRGCLRTGLPPGLDGDLSWRRFGGLEVGVAGRLTLIATKLFAAIDQGPRSKHVHDLVALHPSPEEWERAYAWVIGQDTSPHFPAMSREVIQHVESRVGNSL